MCIFCLKLLAVDEARHKSENATILLSGRFSYAYLYDAARIEPTMFGCLKEQNKAIKIEVIYIRRERQQAHMASMWTEWTRNVMSQQNYESESRFA